MKKLLTAIAVLMFCFALSISAWAECGTTTWNLTAGQTIDVGSVTVSNDIDNIYITYTLDYPGASFGELHAWVGNSLLNLPANQQGIPVPGQFCQSLGGACYDATGLTTYTFTIPFTALNIVDANAACGSSLYVVTHAEVEIENNGEIETETAFGGDTPGDGPRWWFYGIYKICCDTGEPPVCLKKTAFAKGGWVWTTDRKSNPESLPSLNLIKNRWGWAINLIAPGTTYYDIWAGAGLNNTSKGVKVGTLTIDWNGAAAIVTYDMLPGYYLEEVHIYADDASPYTTAPGQFGYPVEGYDVGGVETFSYVVPLADANATGSVWLIAHAVISSGTCQ